MTLLSPPVSRGGPPPEDLDWTLRAFYQAQMPNPWPPAPVPTARHTTPPVADKPRSWRPLLRSRLALAASVALLAAGTLFLSGAFRGGSAPAPEGIQVTRPGADRRYNPMDQPTPPTPKVVDETLIQGPSGTSYKVTVENP